MHTRMAAHFPYEIDPISRKLSTSWPETVHVSGVDDGYAHVQTPFTNVLHLNVRPRKSDCTCHRHHWQHNFHRHATHICQQLERVLLVIHIVEGEEPEARKRPRLDAVK